MRMKLMLIAPMFLIFGFGPKIESVKCSTPRNCVVRLNKVVTRDTVITVTMKDGKTTPVKIKAGTQDAAFFLHPTSEVYVSAKIGK